MARLAAILVALGRALGRDLKSSWSLKGNNFFIVSVLVLQDAGAFIYLIVGLVMLFPLSTDPLRRIPASRLNLWPLDRRERCILRAASPWKRCPERRSPFGDSCPSQQRVGGP